VPNASSRLENKAKTNSFTPIAEFTKFLQTKLPTNYAASNIYARLYNWTVELIGGYRTSLDRDGHEA